MSKFGRAFSEPRVVRTGAIGGGAARGFGRVRPVGPVSAAGLRSTPHHAPSHQQQTAKPTLSSGEATAATAEPADASRVRVAAYTRRAPARPA